MKARKSTSRFLPLSLSLFDSRRFTEPEDFPPLDSLSSRVDAALVSRLFSEIERESEYKSGYSRACGFRVTREREGKSS